MDLKQEIGSVLVREKKRRQSFNPYIILSVCVGFLLLLGSCLRLGILRTFSPAGLWTHSRGSPLHPSGNYNPRDVHYNLTMSQAWRNPDGGHWRPMFVGNSESPVPVINVREGDLIHLNVHNDLGIPSALHWFGFHHYHSQTWNDGTAGVTTYPILPRANWTSTLNTSGHWGLKWYTDHCTTPLFDGFYGTIWIRPSPERERPYHMVSSDEADIEDMLDSEATPEHVTIYNYQHRTYDNLLSQLQHDGYEPYCFQSVLINGKGRVHCRPYGVGDIGGEPIDSHGCVKQPTGAVGYGTCIPTYTDYEASEPQIIETKNRRWMMMNFINNGLEHAWRVSIDSHKMWVVANDAGFVTAQQVDIITLRNGQRLTVMVKLDQNPDDYAIRFHADSKQQSLQGYAILRYPHRRTGERLGAPMARPAQALSAMHYAASPLGHATLLSEDGLRPYPPAPPPQHADVTLHMRARGAPDPHNPFVTNYTLNGAPWQLWRALRSPLVLAPSTELRGPNPVVRGLPVGSVVDVVVQNELEVALPMYKHNDATWLLGRGDGEFGWGDVAAAESEGVPVNLADPVRGFFHVLPARGWMVLRWRIEQPAMTMFHAVRARQFVMGMQVPMFEGDDHWPEVPQSVSDRPHVEFEMPERMGIFD
ncbi:Cupredoxin [Macrophomina phaseolina]|uniref:Cupredoxin n=1 Tax=Macrophomina phaseolina TaxID=35725 RepID=A0ABQ8GR12_9PEZI|nr:Cupredoxin [Macrophomina phaseolina]